MVYIMVYIYGIHHDIYHLPLWYIPWYIPKVVYTTFGVVYTMRQPSRWGRGTGMIASESRRTRRALPETAAAAAAAPGDPIVRIIVGVIRVLLVARRPGTQAPGRSDAGSDSDSDPADSCPAVAARARRGGRGRVVTVVTASRTEPDSDNGWPWLSHVSDPLSDSGARPCRSNFLRDGQFYRKALFSLTVSLTRYVTAYTCNQRPTCFINEAPCVANLEWWRIS
jgi:hypothetical protein